MTTVTTPAGKGIAGSDRSQDKLLDVQSLASLLGCSTRHCYRLADGGKMPRPLKLGSLVRWRAAEIQEWIVAGCPSVRSMRSTGQ